MYKLNDGNDIGQRGEEIRLFCYYKVLALHTNQYSVIRK